MNVEPPRLDPATERIANNILRHLEWQVQGFSLVFLFGDVGPGLSLASWLDQQLIKIGMRLERHDVSDDFVAQPQKLVDEIVDQRVGIRSSKEPLWLWLPRHPVDEQWNSARRVFLARLNERRFLLERDLGRPLILVLPFAFKSDARAIAPDLWTIRALSEDLRALQAPGVAAVGTSALPVAIASGVGWVGAPLPSSFDASSGLPAYDDWRRAYAAAPERAFLPTARDAVSELMRAGRPADAKVIAEQALRVAEKRAAATPTDPAALYELALSLDTAGGVASAQGSWTEAERLYRKSLAIARQLLGYLGDTPEALRNLSVSLNMVADVAKARGNWSEAESFYRESLSISRQLLERLGTTPEILRDISVSLHNVAGVANTQGNLNEAESLYRESLAISRQVLKRLGSTPDALRDLSVSLNLAAEVASAKGSWSEAEKLYRESLAIRRQLIERVGGTPEAMRDLSISWGNVAGVAGAQGDWIEAKRLYQEGLAISRQLIESVGDTPGALRDLAISLDNVADAASVQGNWSEAEHLYRESLAISRQLLARNGDTPDALDDVGISLFKLGTLQGERDEALLKEALQIYERLESLYPKVAKYQTRLQLIREALEATE